jgi:hypothetical protein
MANDQLAKSDVELAVADDEVALHRRSLEYLAYERGEQLLVVGRLTDRRPWLEGTNRLVVHDMELRVLVAKADLVIRQAKATMFAFPHGECPDIAPVFAGLVGLSVARGYVKAVQQRFVGPAGCSHLDHLARGLGPAVIQSVASTHGRDMRAALERARAEGRPRPSFAEARGAEDGGRAMPRVDWLANTCHIWADDGVGMRKVELGWSAIEDEYPVPRMEVLIGRKPPR